MSRTLFFHWTTKTWTLKKIMWGILWLELFDRVGLRGQTFWFSITSYILCKACAAFHTSHKFSSELRFYFLAFSFAVMRTEMCACHFAATWVGGTFIIGTAETVYNPKFGLIWAVMPLAATLAFVVGTVPFFLWFCVSAAGVEGLSPNAERVMRMQQGDCQWFHEKDSRLRGPKTGR